MRQDFFTYLPAFKLVIAGNHKPGLRGVDEAIRRRFHLVPFTVTIPKPKRDQDLPDKLRAEWPGILRWMIDGCLAWQREGLNPPAIVRGATESYLGEEDAIARWIEDCCGIDPIYFCRVAELFADWRNWADAAGEYVGSQKRFSQSLSARGFESAREGGTGKSGFRGIALQREQVRRM